MNPVNGSQARVVAEEPAEQAERVPTSKFEGLRDWVIAKTDAWRQWRDDNYETDWGMYERLWRGQWSADEKMRESERSRIVSPALAEAVENACAEIEEAVFGRGADFYDIEADLSSFEDKLEGEQEPSVPKMGTNVPEMGTPEGGMEPPMGPGTPPMPLNPIMAAMMAPKRPDPHEDVEKTRASLREDLRRSDFSTACTETVLYSAVFGTGFAEIVTEDRVVRVMDATGIGSKSETLEMPVLRAWSPRNVIVDPNAMRIELGLGVAVEEMVSNHTLKQAQKKGQIDPDVDLDANFTPENQDIEGDVLGAKKYDQDKANLIRWYGLVPTKLLFPENHKVEDPETKEERFLTASEAEDGDYTEAIVVIVNKVAVMKAVENPAPKRDRPVLCFPWDQVPGRLHGRGICEKGANSQKILDAEIRARLDGLALTWAPMVGMDATRVPRGAKFVTRPGGTFLTNGDPESVIRPIKLGTLDPNHWQNQQALQAMVHQATGSLDATGLANSVGDARSGAVSMAMAPVIKRYKRTLGRFFDLFLMPALDKVLSRSQQSMPDRYPATTPIRMRPASTMGIMQREYETQQMTALLSSLPPEGPEHRAVLMGIISNSSIPNRETVLKMLAGADERAAQAHEAQMEAQKDPMLVQLQQVTVQLQMAEMRAKIRKLEADAGLSEAKAQAIPAQLQVDMMQTATKGLYSTPEGQQASEFDRRVKMAQTVLQGKALDIKEKDISSNERITAMQLAQSARDKHLDRMAKLHTERMKATKAPKIN